MTSRLLLYTLNSSLVLYFKSVFTISHLFQTLSVEPTTNVLITEFKLITFILVRCFLLFFIWREVFERLTNCSVI